MTDTAAETAQWVIRIGLALAFIGMGINHFVPKAAHVMAKLIPPGLRGAGALSPLNLVRFPGVCEIAGGIGLLLPFTRAAAAIALVAFLIAVWPANNYAAANPDRFGSLAIPFWRRFAAQLALILLVILAAI